ncbi:MAG: hypothetical protein LBG19_02260 [Prevotellaceae bacterium]|jgi:transcriptional regulator with XRE-family HTH domain|nr:hypothetical protein [Prevotellaceae bacterium]
MDTATRVHHGRNLKSLRTILGKKQETVAKELFGENSQAMVSRHESEEVIEDNLLNRYAKYYGVDFDRLKNTSLEPHHTVAFNDNTIENIGTIFGDVITNNPLEEVLKISQEKEELYQKLAQKEEEKVTLLLKHVDQLEKRLEKLEAKK